MDNGQTIDGDFKVFPDGSSSFWVFCEMSKGGLTRVLNKVNFTSIFNKSWAEFKIGFGDYFDNYWLGLENMRTLVSAKPTKMRVECTNTVNTFFETEWVTIGTEAEKYQLFYGYYTVKNINLYSWVLQNGSYFTTYDNDNDQHTINCAAGHQGGWWFSGCFIFCGTCFKIPGAGHIRTSTGWVTCEKFQLLIN